MSVSIFGRVARALGLGRARYYIGKDLDQNKYYEYPALDGSTDPRRTRRLIRYRVHKELGEHDQASLPAQWIMWLRHTRRSAPTVEELLLDKDRIEITRHNARILEQRDTERRLQLESAAQEETRNAQQLEPSLSQPSQPSLAATGRATAVPTAAVSDQGIEQEGHSQQQRHVDMDVWEASRRRVDQQNEQQEDAFSRRAKKRAALDDRDAERDRARRAMSRSPLEDFDVTYEGAEEAGAPAQAEQLKPRFGRAVGPGEEWRPQAWSPAPASRR